MKILIDTDNNTCIVEENQKKEELSLYSKEAFEILSKEWVKVGWNEKYTYTFSWFGRPIIQMPEDMIRIQELIYKLKPDVIVETGVAHGGSLIYYASICRAIGKGRVVGVDIEIRPHNRNSIEEHELYPLITLIEGSSVEESTLEKVKNCINHGEKVLVILDSCHTRDHVYNELKMYSELVSKEFYIVVQDGIMEDLYDVPRGQKSWKEDNPVQSVCDFLKENDEFVLETPKRIFNESSLKQNITHWPSAWLKRIKNGF
ncbi:hydroxylase [Clostridium botulinum]|uniref:Hydroxylase n=3 Tax=Clostridium botulinum TaxID=1491 RepID=A5I5E6_CLOBH|nr:CmcI family methyltransferase [Clostridium botulinum]ABS34675.1 cephalosporin hydroxylase family protein [Clostridium botulinum A str. ATCC 19397]ABS36386.1 cephalosporin hydroxylase family protein [Clostridium botulinum A str. Hall]APH21127.1 cephalosporin hydroxylase family protein [Clostridium botulinum]APQ67939.1 cephalosporin hydroxylase family protein [Clostridium botulinum]APQ74155.1 cephalosporin hydroxylase family protein [Clostridium botulinum]